MAFIAKRKSASVSFEYKQSLYYLALLNLVKVIRNLISKYILIIIAAARSIQLI